VHSAQDSEVKSTALGDHRDMRGFLESKENIAKLVADTQLESWLATPLHLRPKLITQSGRCQAVPGYQEIIPRILLSLAFLQLWLPRVQRIVLAKRSAIVAAATMAFHTLQHVT
jgi:hypothetical protein